MHMPDKFKVKNGKLELNIKAVPPRTQKDMLKIIQNMYRLVETSFTWHQHLLKKGLNDIGFQECKVDPCLFHKDKLFLLYDFDNVIFFSPNKGDADKVF